MKEKIIKNCATCDKPMAMWTPEQKTHKGECKMIYDKKYNEIYHELQKNRRYFNGMKKRLTL